MDDTALQTPRRGRHVSHLKPFAKTLPEVPEHRRVDKRVTCSADGCQRKVRVRTPARAVELQVSLLHRQARGEIPVFCEPCTIEIDRRDTEAEYIDRRAAVVERRLPAAGIPSCWHEATWEGVELDPTRHQAIEAARRWSRAEGSRGVLLYGDVGRGKSHIAAVAAVERCQRSKVKWINMAELGFALSRSMSDPKRTAALDLLEPGAFEATVALVLDDLDKVRTTETGIQPVYLAVNAWIEAQQPLLVTMNADLDRLSEEFGPRWGDAIASRLGGYCQQLEVGGPDRRLA